MCELWSIIKAFFINSNFLVKFASILSSNDITVCSSGPKEVRKIYRTRAIRLLRSIYSISHFFACGLFEKAVYSRRYSISLINFLAVCLFKRAVLSHAYGIHLGFESSLFNYNFQTPQPHSHSPLFCKIQPILVVLLLGKFMEI